MLMKDCRIEKIGDKLVRISSIRGKEKINCREERIGRYVEDYKADKKSIASSKSKEGLKEECKKLGIVVKGNPCIATLEGWIKAKEEELEAKEKSDQDDSDSDDEEDEEEENN